MKRIFLVLCMIIFFTISSFLNYAQPIAITGNVFKDKDCIDPFPGVDVWLPTVNDVITGNNGYFELLLNGRQLQDIPKIELFLGYKLGEATRVERKEVTLDLMNGGESFKSLEFCLELYSQVILRGEIRDLITREGIDSLDVRLKTINKKNEAPIIGVNKGGAGVYEFIIPRPNDRKEDLFEIEIISRNNRFMDKNYYLKTINFDARLDGFDPVFLEPNPKFYLNESKESKEIIELMLSKELIKAYVDSYADLNVVEIGKYFVEEALYKHSKKLIELAKSKNEGLKLKVYYGDSDGEFDEVELKAQFSKMEEKYRNCQCFIFGPLEDLNIDDYKSGNPLTASARINIPGFKILDKESEKVIAKIKKKEKANIKFIKYSDKNIWQILDINL